MLKLFFPSQRHIIYIPRAKRFIFRIIVNMALPHSPKNHELVVNLLIYVKSLCPESELKPLNR
jgi:hypothetical protein